MGEGSEYTNQFVEDGNTDPGFVVEKEQVDLFEDDWPEEAPIDYKPVVLQEDDALDVVGTGRALKAQKNMEAEMKARDFGMNLNKLLLEGTDMKLEGTDEKESQLHLVRDFISSKGQLLYKVLSEGKPSIDKLTAGISAIVLGILKEFKISLCFSNDEMAEKINQAFHLIWIKPIQPYILNYLLRKSSIKTLDLLRVWKDSIQAKAFLKSTTSAKDPDQVTFVNQVSKRSELSEQDLELWNGVKDENTIINEGKMCEAAAVEDLRQYAYKANKFAGKFFHNGGSNYFCKEIFDTNDIRILQKIVAEEHGFSHESWERKHHAYIKISLMYAILMVDGKLQPERIEYISGRLREKIKTICFRYGRDPETNEPIYILNPKRNEDGSLSESEESILISGIHINTKHDFSLLLKFIMKVLSDSIAPSIDNIRDLIRGRIMMLKDPRKSHSSFSSYTTEEADIAAATKILAILMGLIGTSVDKRNIRFSIDDGGPINKDSTGKRIVKSLQLKTFPMFDTDEHGNIASAGQTYSIEWQIIKYILKKEHLADIEEYSTKKYLAAEMQLGVVKYKEFFLDICEVFINQYGFPNHDTLEQRKLREQAFGPKSRQKPLMQEIVAAYIVEGILAETPKTQEDIKAMLADPVTRKIIEDAMDKVGSGMYPWTFYHLQSHITEFINLCRQAFGNDCGYVNTFNQILGMMKDGYQSPAVITVILDKLKKIKEGFIYNAYDIYPNNPIKSGELELQLDGLLYLFETGPDQILARYGMAKKRMRKLCSQIDTESVKCKTCPVPGPGVPED